MASPAPPSDDVVSVARALPKTELHLHLDGSLSVNFMFRRAAARGIQMPSDPQTLRKTLWAGGMPGGDTEMRKRVLAAMPNLKGLPSGQNWLIFDFRNQFLQTKEELREATADLVWTQCHVDNTQVIEIRFAPVLHTLEGLTTDEKVEAVAAAGFAEGARDCDGAGGVGFSHVSGTGLSEAS